MIHSDLLHVLENVNNGNDVILTHPVIFNNTEKIVKVFKKGKSWKAEDSDSVLYTISTLSTGLQVNLRHNILAMFDKRVSPQQYNAIA